MPFEIMECITVLKHPGVCTDTVDYSATVCNSKTAEKPGSGRICSRDWQPIAIVVLLTLLMLSLASQSLLWTVLDEFRDELTGVREKLKENEVHRDQLQNQISYIYERQKQSGAPCQSRNRKRPSRSQLCPDISIPHFYMKGKGKEDHDQNRFLWDGTDGIASGQGPFEARKDCFVDPDAVTSVQIKQAGTYYIYAQTKVHGHRHLDEHESVGITLKKHTNETLTKAIITQDGKGLRYDRGNNHFPVDTLSLSGIFYLEREDVISITPLGHQQRDHFIHYKNDDADSSHFGGFMLEGSGGCF